DGRPSRSASHWSLVDRTPCQSHGASGFHCPPIPGPLPRFYSRSDQTHCGVPQTTDRSDAGDLSRASGALFEDLSRSMGKPPTVLGNALILSRQQRIWVWAVAILLRLALLFTPPFLSDDIYRYSWEGCVQRSGLNPYRDVPSSPDLAFLRN